MKVRFIVLFWVWLIWEGMKDYDRVMFIVECNGFDMLMGERGL